MSLPKTFQFSASSLQDYVDCPRRFQLRYLLQVSWPAPEVEPIDEQERRSEVARDFHQLVHQHLLGLPTEALSASIQDTDLERWWRAYLAYVPILQKHQAVVPEIALSTPLGGYRLVARYDAIVVKSHALPGQDLAAESESLSPSLLIVDWKTHHRRPSRTWLSQRLQTRVYPLVLVEAGTSIFNRFPSGNKESLVQPDDVAMQYWLAEFPQDPEIFVYDTSTYRADLDYISALIAEISDRAGRSGGEPGSMKAFISTDIWPLTSDVRQCHYCNYRSLCGRGDVAGPLTEYLKDDDEEGRLAGERDLGFDLDWGQVQEIVY